MNNTPYISVVVPVFNVEKYLERCIDSLVNQTFQNIEIILVDDGSTDNSGSICDTYAIKDERIQVIHKPNGGLVSARKAGLRIAKGKYVSNIDSDDWIEHEAYEYAFEMIQRHNVDMVCCSFYKDYGTLTENRQEYLDEGLYRKNDILKQFRTAVEDMPFYCPVMHDSLCTKIIRRDLLNEVQFSVDESIVMGEDDAVSLPLLLLAESIYISKKSFYHYCVNNASVSWEKRHDDLKRLSNLSESLKKRFLTLADKENYGYIYKYFLFTMAFIWLDMMDLAETDYLEQKKVLPFWDDVTRGSRIIVYGKGLWATNLINVIKESNFCEVIANIDSGDFDEYLKLLNSSEYDFIIVAIADIRICKKVKEALLQAGVKSYKICMVNKNRISKESIPFL